MNTYLIIFLILLLGYLIGSIHVKGISLGTSGVLLIALVMGHFEQTVPAVIKNLGLICFVTSVGIIAGPVFFENFKKRAGNYVLLGFLTILIGAAVCVGTVALLKIPTALAVGLMNGALTSTPGLAAALEATNDPMASVGYGIAYPFGVLGVVFFVQLLPRMLKTDVKAEVAEMAQHGALKKRIPEKLFEIEPLGFFAIAVAVVTGVLIGSITIPLPGGARFSLGNSGGPLLTGLLVGHFCHLGPIDLRAKKTTLECMREFGLALFLLGAGTEAGQGFVAVLQQYGWRLFFSGVAMTLIPMIASYLIATKLMRLTTINALGSITGGMTSTPALGTLISVTGSDAVATAYAATYPIALISVVLCSQFIAIMY